MKFDRTEFFAGAVWNVLACSVGTRCHMDSWRLQPDSDRQIGLGRTSHDFSDCSGEPQEGGEVCWGGIFAGGVWNVFACTAGTSGPMEKLRQRLDSA